MAHDPFDTPVDQSKPLHCFFHEPEQYRLKVRRFSQVPPELTIQKVDMSRDADGYQRAWQNGQNSYGLGRKFRSEKTTQGDESKQRSQRRAQIQVRLQTIELAPTALVTFTTRETMTLEALLWCWQYFTRMMRENRIDFDYVAVPERHPTNPEHLHIHAAYRGETNFKNLRRMWHIALEARHGRRATKTLYGPDAPGNIDVQKIKARDPIKSIRKIGKYIAKYITKDLISEFNKKRYWPSKGITLENAKIFWLSSLNQVDAIREACRMMGQWDESMNASGQRMFVPSDRIAWMAVDPALTPPPPF